MLNKILGQAYPQDKYINPHPIPKNNSEYEEIILSNEDI
jgi:hypothetical protein